VPKYAFVCTISWRERDKISDEDSVCFVLCQHIARVHPP